MIGSLAASVQSIGTTLTNLSTEFVESVVDNRLCKYDNPNKTKT